MVLEKMINKNILLKSKLYLLNENKSIFDAIKKLQISKIKTLIVINKKRKLIGTVTDGDIRRGILKGYNGSDAVLNIANKRPYKKILGLKNSNKLEKKNISVLPVVNKENILKSLEFFNFNSDFSNFTYNTEILIMAGGFGKRLMPITKKIPKPLIKIKKKTLLEIIINNFKKYGFREFKISTFYKSNLIKKYFKKKKLEITIDYIQEKTPLGTAGCLGLLNYKDIKKNIIIHNGDIISDLNISNLLKFHEDSESDITICAKEKINSSPFGQILFKGQKVKKILEKPKNKNFINAGIYVFKKEVIKNILPKKIDITSLIESKILKGLNVNIYPIYEYWVDIGRRDVLKEILKGKND